MRFLLLLILSIGLTSYVSAQKKNNKFVLVLDAGHGGKDPGTLGVVENEKHIALDITLKVGKLIENHYGKDVNVIYTRKDDRFIELKERANIANRNKADLFVSIHCNAASPSAHGTETFVLGTEEKRSSPNFNVVKKENSVILLEDNHEETYQGFDPNSPESLIGLTLMQNVHLDNSLLFAKAVEENFVNKDKRKSRGVRQAGFLVLWRTATPSVLIETGFISNSKEGNYLATEKGQDKTAKSIFNAFKEYKKEWDTRQDNTIIEEAPEKEEINIEPEKAIAGKIFKVQFLTSKRRFRSSAPQLKGLKNVEIQKVGKVYKYFYGKTSFASKRDYNLSKVKRAGFPDAFIVEIPTTVKKEETKDNKESQEKRTNGYRIQILTSQRNYKANAPQMKGVKPVDKIESNGLYKYYFGWFDSEDEAKKELIKIRSRGFADAFIVKFLNGKKK